jgi:hypothetical protein
VASLSPQLLAGLLKQGCKPSPVDSIDTENDRYPDEDYYHPTYMAVLDKEGKKNVAKGLAPGKIKTFDDKQPVYTVSDYIRHTSAGSPLFVNDKIIGMVLNETGVITNADIIKDPYKNAKSGTVVKASLIIPLLRKLQIRETTKGL